MAKPASPAHDALVPTPAEPVVRWEEDAPRLPWLADQGDPPTLAALQQRYPRTVVELRVLECLRGVAPLALSPQQVSLVLHVEVSELRDILQALKLVGAIEHSGRGLYRHRPQ